MRAFDLSRADRQILGQGVPIVQLIATIDGIAAPELGHDIEQIEHIIVGACFERAHECQQCCDPLLIGQPRDGLRFGGVGEAVQVW
jgi:hypothetical protein